MVCALAVLLSGILFKSAEAEGTSLASVLEVWVMGVLLISTGIFVMALTSEFAKGIAYFTCVVPDAGPVAIRTSVLALTHPPPQRHSPREAQAGRAQPASEGAPTAVRAVRERGWPARGGSVSAAADRRDQGATARGAHRAPRQACQ